MDAEKDRTITLALASGRAELVYRRSSAHPVVYAIMLRVRKGDKMVNKAIEWLAGNWEDLAS